ncbi:MAG TPA: pyrroline-5-carboxylate reductase dimerization domain-containing protein [Solirubrobacterales bacterium]|nr:NAD(P)-binding domain-containing protein [Solirubrobacterales bacterium]HMX70623.1 pyrroline-5-carboxylate reductase dimerization domain-containing protein [Solirubrobacterales bacterium]HMY26465.1 pyrroline-5-carboxylate reductase dimerization domain-containing protein [Solirubrobacterales bacterium]HNA22866.1 pyrroline-5-carboxylate reductase dimerization domain-containing protein [Solirubrobacterales bacterium]HNC04760.1 pyrroline-5-carboxylate reductase dimerization domain-containing pro
MVVGFIGSGNMAAAMARGWASAEDDSPSEMLFTDSGSGRATALAKEVGGRAVESNEELVRESDFVILAVKPAALELVAEKLPAPRAVLSLLGATPLEKLVGHFPDSAVIRLMPNLGVEVNRGVVCMAEPEGVDEEILADTRKLLGSIARVHELPDESMDVATAVMGCSPAYFAVVAEALGSEGAHGGLEPDVAIKLVSESLAGTAALLGSRTPFEIQTAVASPGGSTEAGLEALAAAGGADAFRAAFEASIARMRGN